MVTPKETGLYHPYGYYHPPCGYYPYPPCY